MVSPLQQATPQQRLGFEIGRDGLHWAEIDEDISIAGLLAGRRDQGRRFEKSQLSDVFAMLKSEGPARSMEDMDAAVLAEARRKNGIGSSDRIQIATFLPRSHCEEQSDEAIRQPHAVSGLLRSARNDASRESHQTM
jgi:hypothetical protein